MYLKTLEINGFKSFGRKTSLSFSTPITAIVGPNGSGKSNVAEAFRFVLGEQSMKSMRGKRGEDLIFNGSGESSRLNRAGVKLIFDNSRRLFPIDFDEVTIERVVYRDSQNEYFLNGSKVRLKDVQELLLSAHIGSTGHHIISQGEADRILHASPKERRDIIEDALGIKIYKYKKEESQRKLERTELNKKEVESLRREIAPHLRFLKKQVEKLKKAEELKREIIERGKAYFKSEDADIKENKSKNEAEEKPLKEEFQKFEKSLEDAKKIVEAGLRQDSAPPEIISLENNIRESRKRKDEINILIGQIEGEISFAKRSIERELEKAKVDESKVIKFSEVKNIKSKIDEIIDGSINQSSLEFLRHALSSIKSLFGEFFKKFEGENRSEELLRLEEEVPKLISKKEETLKKKEEISLEEKRLVGLLEEKREELIRVKDKTKEAEKEIFRIIAKENEIRALIDKVESKKHEVRIREENFKNDLNDFASLVGVEIMRFDEEGVSLVPKENLLSEKKDLERIKIRLEEIGVTGASDVMKEFKETEERDAFLLRELEDLSKAQEDLEVLIKELEEKLDVEFKEGVSKINTAFHDFFKMMFGGGSAGIRVLKQEKRKNTEEEDGEVLIEEGIDVDVSLPHKKIKGLMMLSGGERALSSIALLFAISQVNPPPFIILDETDAALDEANSRKYGDMLESLSKHSELIVITHNRETMSRAGIIYGVTMGKDATSKLLSIAFEEAEAVAK